MTPEQARSVAQSLIAAADKAEAAGLKDIDLLSELRAADDVARADLDQAIRLAKQAG